MAEHVQEALDRMVAPLRDLMDRQIFTEQEIKAIVSRRRESEYLLRRLTARKADFLRYIQAEQGLEKLRQLRTKQRQRDHLKSKTESSEKQQQHIGDAHVIQHLHLLFVRAIRKFRSDISLHLLHADFCKEIKSFSRLGRVYAEALQIFPRQPGLWIEAASNEFFGPNKSIRNARILLQRGLRFNKSSQDIWCESFSLELHYAQTLRGRRQILLGAKNMEEIAESANYKIVEVIYKNAIQAISDSIPFRLRLMDTCRRFPETEALMELIQAPLEKDFQTRPEAWLARALFEAERQSKRSENESENDSDDEDDASDRPPKRARTKDEVVAILEKAVETLPNDNMYLQAFRFARNYQNELKIKEKSVVQIQEYIKNLLELMHEHSSSELALEHADYLIEIGENIKAEKVLETFCAGKDSLDASPWIQLAGLTSSSSKLSVLARALEKIPVSSSVEHMKVLLQFFGCQLLEKEDNTTLFDTFQCILLLAPSIPEIVVEDIGACESFGLQSVARASVRYLEYAATLGLKKARSVYSAVLFSSSIVVNASNMEDLKEFVEMCVQLEGKDKMRRTRLFDRAIELFEDTPFEEWFRQQRNDNAANF
jgi:U3 small nucleolar RNA-associated protein 6